MIELDEYLIEVHDFVRVNPKTWFKTTENGIFYVCLLKDNKINVQMKNQNILVFNCRIRTDEHRWIERLTEVLNIEN